MATIKTKHAVAGIILGLLSGFAMTVTLSGFVVMFTLTVAPLLLLPTIVISLLGIWAGIPSAIIATVSNIAAAYALGGSTLAIVAVEAAVVPAWCVIALIARRSKYYDGIRQSVFMQCGAFFVLIAGAWLTIGGDLVEYVLDKMRLAADAYMDGYTSSLLTYMGQAGVFGSQTGLDFTKALSVADQSALLDAIFASNATVLKQNFVSMMLSCAVTTGAASYALCSSVVAKRGDDPIIDYTHPYDWRLSKSLIIGPPICTIVLWIAYLLGMEGADSAYLALYTLSVRLFMVQGIGAVDRRLRTTGATKAIRTFALIVLVLTGLYELLAILGVVSALLGSKGLLSTYIKKRNDKGDGRQ